MDLFTQAPPVPTVTQVTNQLKRLVESQFQDVLVQGEVSQPRPSGNGHVYFTLKDDGAQLPCVIWRSSAERMKIVLEHGQQITAGGEIQLYAPQGKYQLIVNYIQVAGLGALQAKFEALKQKLQAEGLFDQARKRRLPAFPSRIGVVTSETGAAFQDIRTTIEKRWPLAEIVLFHASVQGAAAAGEIVRGINWFSENKTVDVLIIGRGGGSLEDLWPFNEEIVARAVFACSVPVISAVGHETDFSISDFVADVRAATPTQAAVLATPDQNDIRLYLDDVAGKTQRGILRKLETARLRVENLSSSHLLRRLPARFETEKTRIQHLSAQLKNAQQVRLQKWDRTAHELSLKLAGLNPDQPMERGFARIMQEGKWVKKKAEFETGKPAEMIWKDGAVRVG